MKITTKVNTLLAMSVFFLAMVNTTVAGAVEYEAVILHPSGFDESRAWDVSSGHQVGSGEGTDTAGDTHALLWSGTPESVVDLHPSGFTESSARAIFGTHQVGYGWNLHVSIDSHAIMWSGTAESAVDLHPPSGFEYSHAYDISGGRQVGYGGLSPTGYPSHALLWSGTAESVVDIHPTWLATSQASGISGGQQVGSGSRGHPYPTNALLWEGSADSAVNLNPNGFYTTLAFDVSGGQQVGYGWGSSTGDDRHALLWSGTAESVVDLNPRGFDETMALAISVGQQVGSGVGRVTGDKWHALLWQGTSDSVVDLHTFLSAGYDTSWADGIDSEGNIVGYAYTTAGDRYAVLWVPELAAPPFADADGPYVIYVGDMLTLDANGSTDEDNDIASYMWDLDDNGSFETDASGQAIFVVNYTYLESLGLLIDNTYNIHLKVTDSEGQSDTADSILTIVPEPEPMVYYVDDEANGLNDGSSWCDAYNYLQDALAVAQSGDQIWVAEGIYKPDANTFYPDGTGDRTATFQLINGVAIKGGYAGFGQPDPNARDIELYETTLSGDLNGNDIGVSDPCDLLNEPTRAENSYHVVTGSERDGTAVLDGFTIIGGNADGPPWSGKDIGGGMYDYRGSPTVTNCTFKNNSAKRGGGMGNYRSSPRLTNCTFRCNSGWWGVPSPPDGGSGAGMYNNNSSPTLVNCTFIENEAVLMHGGGMYNYQSSPTLTNCIFSGNGSYEYGGGMCNYCYCSPTLTNCIFSGNWVCDHMGGEYGGAMYVRHGTDANLINCTFAGNLAKCGSALACHHWSGESESTVIMTNCIVRDGQNPISTEPQCSVTIKWSNVEGGWLGEGNIDADPCFVDPNGPDGISGTEDDNLRLLPFSLCIDAGDNTAVPSGVTTDLDGNPRFVDDPCTPDTGNGMPPIVDMGAYEANYIEVSMKFTPQALNPGSKGKWVKAHFVLPEGFLPEDVDTNTPAVIALLGIESDHINVFTNEDELVEIEAAFSRYDFCRSAKSNDGIEVIVIGLLNSGQYFYGTDTIRIIDKNIEYIAILAAHWLEADCGKPDWCSGADLDQDSVVNFVDFALFDGCCIEVVKE